MRRTLDLSVSLTAEQDPVIDRVAQQRLTNVVRHANAQRVELRLQSDGDGVTLVVRDDRVACLAMPITTPMASVAGGSERCSSAPR